MFTPLLLALSLACGGDEEIERADPNDWQVVSEGQSGTPAADLGVAEARVREIDSPSSSTAADPTGTFDIVGGPVTDPLLVPDPGDPGPTGSSLAPSPAPRPATPANSSVRPSTTSTPSRTSERPSAAPITSRPEQPTSTAAPARRSPAPDPEPPPPAEPQEEQQPAEPAVQPLPVNEEPLPVPDPSTDTSGSSSTSGTSGT